MAQIAPLPNELSAVLGKFKPITLAEMDSVKLLNRQDTKFVITRDKLFDILNDIKDDYKILEIQNIRVNTYETLYYDTEDKKAYRRHHNGRSNRYKVRYRKYKESDLSFFEVKFKSNKNRTIKNRIVKSDISMELDEQDLQLLDEHTPLNPDKLTPLLWVYFKRITLVSRDMSERMTIDLGLQYKDPSKNSALPPMDLIVVEVKQARFTRSSKIISSLHQHKSYPLKVSKYCLGIISCFGDEVKTNYFKKKLLKIAKITDNEFYRALAAS